MRIWMTLTASMLSVLLLLGSTLTAAATETWCDVDPPVMVRTPGGATRVVFVVNSGPAEQMLQLLLPAIDHDVQSVEGGRATQVKLNVTVRDPQGEQNAVRSEVWSGPARTGELLSVVEGRAGSAMRHTFRLDVP